MPGTSMGFQNNSFYVRKKSLPTKVLSSSTLTYVNFYISIKFIVVFRVNMSQNSTFQYIQLFATMRKYHLRLFNLFEIANNNINTTFKLKAKLGWCLELISEMYKWNPGYCLKFSTNVCMANPKSLFVIKF